MCSDFLSHFQTELRDFTLESSPSIDRIQRSEVKLSSVIDGIPVLFCFLLLTQGVINAESGVAYKKKMISSWVAVVDALFQFQNLYTSLHFS